METVSDRHLKELASILGQDLDDYGMEITSCVVLNGGMCYNTLDDMLKRVKRYENALEKVMETMY